jgi:hypothetical protein
MSAGCEIACAFAFVAGAAGGYFFNKVRAYLKGEAKAAASSVVKKL